MKIAPGKPKGRAEPKASTIISPKTLAAAGRSLFGSYWQSPLAKALKVQDQVMRRWTNDGFPAAYSPFLHNLLRNRGEEINQVLAKLPAPDGGGNEKG